jgi:hypothetical protein
MLTQTKIAEPTSVNGINVDDLCALIEEVKEDAAKGKTHWRIKGNGTREQFAEIHKAVMATSPNFHNVSRPVDLRPSLVVE